MGKLIDKVALLYIRDGRILTSRSAGKDKYYFPGGKREGSETDRETLTREIREELSVEIRPETVRFYGIFQAQAHGKAEGTVVKMSCYTAEFDGTPAPDHEIAEILWITSADIDDVSPVDKLILTDLKEKKMIE